MGTLHAEFFVICLSIIQYLRDEMTTDYDVDGLEIEMDDAVVD
jgi:hypothetical protein